MARSSEILSYIDSVARGQLTGPALWAITGGVRNARQKMGDPRLYLAFVGEFSSGKSTFINALIGSRLLKEAVMPTTACATYIERGGSEIALQATFFDGPEIQATESDCASAAAFLSQRHGRSFASIQEVIEALTSDQEIARTVKGLSISIPNCNIPPGIVIIDTPGFNPGSQSVENHYEITKQVVEEVADTALILTPQEQAMSATLSRFLNENLGRCLHRCSFVLTKIDNLDPELRPEIIDYARQRIARDLGIERPPLFAESAITMLPVRRIPLGKEDDWAALQAEFKLFQAKIWHSLQKSREIMLAEHANALVKQVVGVCAARLEEKSLAISQDREFLDEHKIENIATVCQRMAEQSQSALAQALASLSTSFDMAERRSIERAESIINTGAMSSTKFSNEKLPAIRAAVEDEAARRLWQIGNEVNGIASRVANDEIKKMQLVFARHYDSFPSLRPREQAPQADLVAFKTPTMRFDFAISKIQALQSEENKTAGKGAVLGGIVGFFIGGPVGAAIGAGLGAGGGHIVNDKAPEMRAQALPIVKSEISSFFSELGHKARQEVDGMCAKFQALVVNFANDHASRYGQAVDRLTRQRQAKIDSLDAQISSLRNTLATLANIQDEIAQELAVLKLKD